MREVWIVRYSCALLAGSSPPFVVGNCFETIGWGSLFRPWRGRIMLTAYGEVFPRELTTLFLTMSSNLLGLLFPC